jgi:hypothetical protein
MFKNPRLYKHLKAATEAASNLLHGIRTEQVVPKESNIDDIIASEPSFKSCVQFLMEDLTIERLKNLPPNKRREEIKKTLLRHIKKYLGCPYLNNLIQII